jgi:hypothetical protein
VVFLGVGDRSASALRRAGAELGRLVADHSTAAAAVVPDGPDEQVQAFAEGILLGVLQVLAEVGEQRQGGRCRPGRSAAGGAGRPLRSAQQGRDDRWCRGTGTRSDQYAIGGEEPAVAGGRGGQRYP